MKNDLITLYKSIIHFLVHCYKLGFLSAIRINLFYGSIGLIRLKIRSLKHPLFLRSNSSDKLVLDQIFLYKDYDINLSFNPRVIVDCGANTGMSSVYFKNRYSDAMIIAVEPESSNFKILKMNTELYENIYPVNMGIWSCECNLEILNGHDGEPWSFFLQPTKKIGENVISAIGINELKRKFDLSVIDLLKIDIEGAENELFESNYEEWLPKVKVIIIELHDRFKPLSSRNFFKALGEFQFNIEFKGENIIATNVNLF